MGKEEKNRYKNNDKKPQTAGSVLKTESKWLKELARQNYIYFAEKLQALETTKKVGILREIKQRLTQRFMKMYRHFRHKKYGEPLDSPKTDFDDLQQFKEQIQTEKKLRKSKSKTNDPLVTVIEEESLAESELQELLPVFNPD